jgi:hypothetical protein
MSMHSNQNERTQILPPFLAVGITWTLTGKWSENAEFKIKAAEEEDRLKDFVKRARDSGDVKELSYVEGAVSAINIGLRNLAIIFELRKKNFEELESLRDAQLSVVQEFQTLTSSWQSLGPRLGAVGIGGVLGGSLSTVLGNLPGGVNAAISIGGMIFFYLLHGVVVVPMVKYFKMKDIMKRDYDRNLYYGQYLERSKLVLYSTYQDLERLHTSTFGRPYDETVKVSVDSLAESIIAGAKSTMCEHVHKHMVRGIITADLWSMCETGDGKEDCRYWPKS